MERDNQNNSENASRNEAIKKDIDNWLQSAKDGKNGIAFRTMEEALAFIESELMKLQIKLHPLDPYAKPLDHSELSLAKKEGKRLVRVINAFRLSFLGRDLTNEREKYLESIKNVSNDLVEVADERLELSEKTLERLSPIQENSKQALNAPGIEKNFEDYLAPQYHEKLIPYLRKRYRRTAKIMVAAMIIALKNLQVLQDIDLLTRTEIAELLNKFLGRRTKLLIDQNLERPFNIYNAKDKPKLTGCKRDAFVVKVEFVQNMIGKFLTENNLLERKDSAEIL